MPEVEASCSVGLAPRASKFYFLEWVLWLNVVNIKCEIMEGK